MDPARFDQLSTRVSTRGLSRRHAARGLGAVGLASAFFGLHRKPAAADCPNVCVCAYTGPGEPPFGGDRTLIPGGSYGQCWDWVTFLCHPCSTS